MVVLSATNIGKSYGTDVILENVSFHINSEDRIGIVGLNGAGKSTLMKILTGELQKDVGDFFLSQNTKIGYLRQQDGFEKDSTVIEEVKKIFKHIHGIEKEINSITNIISAGGLEDEQALQYAQKLDNLQTSLEQEGGYQYISEMYGILNSMAFTEDYYNKPISTLSGGERTRLALACLLLEKPDILMLDEPTNHLDIGTLKWLEQYLKAYNGTIVVISHDRYFLDQTVNRIFEIEHKTLMAYDGNYSTFATKKSMQREVELKAYNVQQKEIKRQEDLIKSYKERGTEKLAKRAASREKRLAHVERINKPHSIQSKMKISFKENFKSGNDVIYAEKLGKNFGTVQSKKELFKDVNLDIKKGERICIVGANGVGKTTLLKIIMEQLEPSAGHVKIGHNVDFGYYDQGQEMLNYESTVMEEIHSQYRLYKESEIRSILGRFLFKNDQVFLPIKSLSGGEKARLSLLKLMMSGSNVLIMDEPTNHLDIESKEIFEDALLDFPGTVLVVSHDRYFLNKIPTRILELEKSGMREYLGKYDYYMEKKSEIVSGKKYVQTLSDNPQNSKNNTTVEQTDNISSAEQRSQNKKKEAEERRTKRLAEALEKEIHDHEQKILHIQQEMCDEKNFTNHVYLQDLDKKLQETKGLLEVAYEHWVKIT